MLAPALGLVVSGLLPTFHSIRTLEMVVPPAIPLPAVIVAPSTTEDGLSTTKVFCPDDAADCTVLELTLSPTVNNGSLTDISVELTVVVVPATWRLPRMITSPPASPESGNGSMISSVAELLSVEIVFPLILI